MDESMSDDDERKQAEEDDTPSIEEIVEAFLAEKTTPDRAVFTTTEELVAAARAWCGEKGEHAFGRVMIARALKRRGLKPFRTNTRRGWRGVRIR
jgi:hypothetical protein